MFKIEKFKNSVNWLYTTILNIPLLFGMYFILNMNLSDDKSVGIIGVLILFSFNQFFFQRRNLMYTQETIIGFYVVGILSSLFISFTFHFTQYDWLSWLVLFQIYFFFQVLNKTSILTNSGEKNLEHLEEENKNKKWYETIWASKTQKKENKNFIVDFFIFILVFILILFLIDLV